MSLWLFIVRWRNFYNQTSKWINGKFVRIFWLVWLNLVLLESKFSHKSLDTSKVKRDQHLTNKMIRYMTFSVAVIIDLTDQRTIEYYRRRTSPPPFRSQVRSLFAIKTFSRAYRQNCLSWIWVIKSLQLVDFLFFLSSFTNTLLLPGDYK